MAEGDAHQRQRRVVNAGFGKVQIRGLTGIFSEKATQLRDAWLMRASGAGVVQIDALPWLGRATLDIIGLAGFNYRFESLDIEGKSTELDEAFTTIIHALSRGFSILSVLRVFIPPLRLIVRLIADLFGYKWSHTPEFRSPRRIEMSHSHDKLWRESVPVSSKKRRHASAPRKAARQSLAKTILKVRNS